MFCTQWDKPYLCQSKQGGEGEVEPNQRLMGLIQRAYAKTGQKVVVLIDEYDAPLLDVVHEETNLTSLRQVMRNFYSPLKYCDPYLRFVFLTGITKFSQLSIFSELNNIQNVSMFEDYAAICGITEEEMLTFMNEGIEALAQKRGLTKEKAIKALKSNYDGYHFTWPSPDIYNPFSLLNALNDRKIDSYWFGSGTPTYLIEMLRKYDMTPLQLCGRQKASSESFDAPTERMTDILPLLYQSGYYTITNCNARGTLFSLGIPNREIRIGLLKSLLPNYLGALTTRAKSVTEEMHDALLEDDIDTMFSLLRDLLKAVPHTRNSNHEGNYQQLLATIFLLLGASADVEVHTSDGRIDLVIMTEKKRYLIEVNMNKDAQTALAQIDLKDYESKYTLSTLPIVKGGVNFSSKERNITDWVINN